MTQFAYESTYKNIYLSINLLAKEISFFLFSVLNFNMMFHTQNLQIVLICKQKSTKRIYNLLFSMKQFLSNTNEIIRRRDSDLV